MSGSPLKFKPSTLKHFQGDVWNTYFTVLPLPCEAGRISQKCMFYYCNITQKLFIYNFAPITRTLRTILCPFLATWCLLQLCSNCLWTSEAKPGCHSCWCYAVAPLFAVGAEIFHRVVFPKQRQKLYFFLTLTCKWVILLTVVI